MKLLTGLLAFIAVTGVLSLVDAVKGAWLHARTRVRRPSDSRDVRDPDETRRLYEAYDDEDLFI